MRAVGRFDDASEIETVAYQKSAALAKYWFGYKNFILLVNSIRSFELHMVEHATCMLFISLDISISCYYCPKTMKIWIVVPRKHWYFNYRMKIYYLLSSEWDQQRDELINKRDLKWVNGLIYWYIINNMLSLTHMTTNMCDPESVCLWMIVCSVTTDWVVNQHSRTKFRKSF